jgi:hypothetical protein
VRFGGLGFLCEPDSRAVTRQLNGQTSDVRHSSMTSWLITMGVPRTKRTKLQADTLHQTSLSPYLIVTIQRPPSFKRESALSVLMSLIDVAQAPWSFFQDTKFSNVVLIASRDVVKHVERRGASFASLSTASTRRRPRPLPRAAGRT